MRFIFWCCNFVRFRFQESIFFEWKPLKRSTCFTVWPLHTNYFLTFFHFWNRTCSSVHFAFLIHCFSQHDNGLGKQLHQTKHLWCIRDGVVCRKFLLGLKLENYRRAVKSKTICTMLLSRNKTELIKTLSLKAWIHLQTKKCQILEEWLFVWKCDAASMIIITF